MKTLYKIDTTETLINILDAVDGSSYTRYDSEIGLLLTQVGDWIHVYSTMTGQMIDSLIYEGGNTDQMMCDYLLDYRQK